MTLLEKIFFRPFFRPRNSDNFQKNEKFKKLPKMTQIVQKLGKTNFGHQKMTFLEKNFFRPFFRPKNSEKFQKK